MYQLCFRQRAYVQRWLVGPPGKNINHVDWKNDTNFRLVERRRLTLCTTFSFQTRRVASYVLVEKKRWIEIMMSNDMKNHNTYMNIVR